MIKKKKNSNKGNNKNNNRKLPRKTNIANDLMPRWSASDHAVELPQPDSCGITWHGPRPTFENVRLMHQRIHELVLEELVRQGAYSNRTVAPSLDHYDRVLRHHCRLDEPDPRWKK